MVPIILIGACAAFCILKSRRVKDTSTESWHYKKPEMALPETMEPLKTSSFNGQHRNNGTASDHSDRRISDSSNLGGTKKRRMYDRTYRTNEPLPGKPPVAFDDDKVWDLGEEKEGQAVHTSLTTGDDTPSDPNNGQAVYRHSRQTDIY